MENAASVSRLEYVRNAMCVSVRATPSTLLSRSAMTSASCSWSRTRTMAMSSASPVTEYTSVTPSSSAMPWPTSGMRSTSQLTRTMAVITGRLNYRYASGPATFTGPLGGYPGPGGRDSDLPPPDAPRAGSAGDGEVAVERCHVARAAVLEERAYSTGPSDATRPRTVQLDDPHAGRLQPAQDDLRLFGSGRR